MEEIAVAVNSLSYNQLVDRIITYKASDDSAQVSQVRGVKELGKLKV